MKITKHIAAFGRVQGVCFRAAMSTEATQRQVTGWVRNRLDGSLEAMLQGEAADVEALIAWTRIGPPSARVDRIEITEGDGNFERFIQR